MFVAAIMAVGGLVAITAPQASADPGGRNMYCWDMYHGSVLISDYDCMFETIDIYNLQGNKMLQLDGTCATMLNRRGRTNAYIDTNCQDWPTNRYKGGDTWEDL